METKLSVCFDSSDVTRGKTAKQLVDQLLCVNMEQIAGKFTIPCYGMDDDEVGHFFSALQDFFAGQEGDDGRDRISYTFMPNTIHVPVMLLDTMSEEDAEKFLQTIQPYIVDILNIRKAHEMFKDISDTSVERSWKSLERPVEYKMRYQINDLDDPIVQLDGLLNDALGEDMFGSLVMKDGSFYYVTIAEDKVASFFEHSRYQDCVDIFKAQRPHLKYKGLSEGPRQCEGLSTEFSAFELDSDFGLDLD